MFKKIFTTFSIITLTLILVPACAEQNADVDTVKITAQTEEAASASTEAKVEVEAATADADGDQVSVMDLPVDFSSPEKVEESIEKVRQQAGEGAARELSNALGYILTYDLSVSRNKEKMYKKLNGRTPNAIIAKMKR